MNIDLLKHHIHQQTTRYLDMLYSHDLLPVITKPTRITSHTATLIHHIYTNTVNRLISGILTIDISDHLPVFCMADIPLKKIINKFILETLVSLTQNLTFRISMQLIGMPSLINVVIYMK